MKKILAFLFFTSFQAFAQDENLVDSLAKDFCSNLKPNHRTSNLIPQDYPFFENKTFFTPSNHSFKQLWTDIGYSFNAKYEAEAIVLRKVLSTCPAYIYNIAGRVSENLERKKLIAQLNKSACVCLRDSIVFSQNNYKKSKSLNKLFEVYSDCLLNEFHRTSDREVKNILSTNVPQNELFEDLAADLIMNCPEVQDEIVEMIVLNDYESTEKFRLEKQEIAINEVISFAHTQIPNDSLVHRFISKQSFLIGDAVIKRAIPYFKDYQNIEWFDGNHVSTRGIIIFAVIGNIVKLVGQFDIRFGQFDFDKISFIRFIRPDNIENKDLFLLRAKEYLKEKK